MVLSHQNLITYCEQVLNSLKEDKAKLEIQKEGEKQKHDDKKKFFGFAIILDDRVSNLI